MSFAIIATVDAGARAAEVSGGMSLISPEFVKVMLTGIAGIVSTALVYFKMKGKVDVGKVDVKTRRPLDHDDVYVTHGECKRFMCAMEKRIEAIGPALNRIFMKLNENDRKSEERTIRLHDRLEPVIQKVAANSAKIEMLASERYRRGENEKQNA